MKILCSIVAALPGQISVIWQNKSSSHPVLPIISGSKFCHTWKLKDGEWSINVFVGNYHYTVFLYGIKYHTRIVKIIRTWLKAQK